MPAPSWGWLDDLVTAKADQAATEAKEEEEKTVTETEFDPREAF